MKLIELKTKLSDIEIQSKLEGRNNKCIIQLEEMEWEWGFKISHINLNATTKKQNMIAILTSFDDAIRFIYDLYVGRFDGGLLSGNIHELRIKVRNENFDCMSAKSENLLHHTDIEDGIEIDI